MPTSITHDFRSRIIWESRAPSRPPLGEAASRRFIRHPGGSRSVATYRPGRAALLRGRRQDDASPYGKPNSNAASIAPRSTPVCPPDMILDSSIESYYGAPIVFVTRKMKSRALPGTMSA